MQSPATAIQVAAAASVPSSLTSPQALWKIPEIESHFAPSIPEKSALGPKASGIPILARVSLRLKQDSNLNLGKNISTSLRFIRPSEAEINPGVSRASS